MGRQSGCQAALLLVVLLQRVACRRFHVNIVKRLHDRIPLGPDEIAHARLVYQHRFVPEPGIFLSEIDVARLNVVRIISLAGMLLQSAREAENCCNKL